MFRSDLNRYRLCVGCHWCTCEHNFGGRKHQAHVSFRSWPISLIKPHAQVHGTRVRPANVALINRWLASNRKGRGEHLCNNRAHTPASTTSGYSQIISVVVVFTHVSLAMQSSTSHRQITKHKRSFSSSAEMIIHAPSSVSGSVFGIWRLIRISSFCAGPLFLVVAHNSYVSRTLTRTHTHETNQMSQVNDFLFGFSSAAFVLTFGCLPVQRFQVEFFRQPNTHTDSRNSNHIGRK